MVSPKDISVLIVDDDQVLRETLVANFTRFNFTVAESDGGEDAFKQFKAKPSQIVVTDVRMPKGDGIELLKNIKDIDPWKTTVLMISGFVDSTLDELYHLGAEGFFDKPFTATQVRQAVVKALLSDKDRWKNGVEPTVSRTLKEVPKLSAGEDGSTLGIGRGGFFLPMWEKHPDVGHVIPFTIQVGDGVPVKEVRGMGRVRWARKEREGKLLAGIGIETLYLESSCLDAYADWLRTKPLRAFIPRA